MPFKDKEKRKEYLRNYMRNYMRNYIKKFRANNPWYVTYNNILHRCNDIGRWHYSKSIKNYLTPTDLKNLWFRDKAFLLKKPSIHRKNTLKDYTIDNCEYIEFIKNCQEGGYGAHRHPES